MLRLTVEPCDGVASAYVAIAPYPDLMLESYRISNALSRVLIVTMAAMCDDMRKLVARSQRKT